MTYFTPFLADVSSLSIPEKFTYPFNYSPEPLAIVAASELQNYIQSEIEDKHPFGMNGESNGIGKMFGVLVVRNSSGQLGYISAFSGKLGKKNDYDRFVPPVYDMLTSEGFYKPEEKRIHLLNVQVKELEMAPEYILWQAELKQAIIDSDREIAAFKAQKKQAKEIRESKRLNLKTTGIEADRHAAEKELNRESAQLHYELKHLTAHWKNKIEELRFKIEHHEAKINILKKQRKEMSIALQHKLFENYTFLNAEKQTKSLHAIFPIIQGDLPPSGAGECAAPKLLHYAYTHALTPICLAEFWYGKSPSSEIRKHGYFYPACKTKCLPILTHMLIGLDVDPNPLEDNPTKLAQLDIVYDDEDIIAINKPHDFLSVPGRNIGDSIYTRIQAHYPELKELMVVHRLDMSTSGLILFAKNKAAHKHIQMQFLNRTIHKKYVAVLDGIVENDCGLIDLPLAGDYENRPRQKVCYDAGRAAQTRYEVKKRWENKTLIHFYPISGRTHQLRVHAAHQLGLNTPILGDDLYGIRVDRLYLHAEELSFQHPRSLEEMKLKVVVEFEI
jgi:tRNA pseudouridine32 synthase/23S rRNA pseudouridine746 synthase